MRTEQKKAPYTNQHQMKLLENRTVESGDKSSGATGAFPKATGVNSVLSRLKSDTCSELTHANMKHIRRVNTQHSNGHLVVVVQDNPGPRPRRHLLLRLQQGPADQHNPTVPADVLDAAAPCVVAIENQARAEVMSGQGGWFTQGTGGWSGDQPLRPYARSYCRRCCMK